MATVRGTNASELLDQNDGVTNDFDTIYDYAGNDTIVALGGNDWIIAGDGNDTVYGGDGFDTMFYYGSNAGVIVSLADGFGIGGLAQGDRLYGVEHLYGSLYDDGLIGEDFGNLLVGYSGRDILDGLGGDDTLHGGDDDDTLFGGNGADTLSGDGGADAMSGGAGNDVYFSDAGDTITELDGEGYDVVYSFAYAATLANHVEQLRLHPGSNSVYGFGNAQTNTLIGNSGDNLLNGGDGADDLSGLGGHDIFVFRPGEAQGDVVYEFNGNGAGSGDVLMFAGYGTRQQGASFEQLDATHWQVTSADGSVSETITLVPGYVIDPTHDVMFV